MDALKSLEDVQLYLSYIVPGLIIVWIRAQFLTGKIGSHKEALLTYFALSTIYAAIASIVAKAAFGSDAFIHSNQTWGQVANLAGATLFGLLIGLNASFDAVRRCLLACRLHLPNPWANAWDWRFSRFPPHMIIVTLKDGAIVRGFWGKGSFASSDPEDRDLFISQVFGADENGQWLLTMPGKGIYIAGDEIQTIEILPHT